MRQYFVMIVLAATVIGCGSKEPQLEFIPVRGVVTLDNKPLANADVRTTPVGKTMGKGGGGRTNEQGEFQIVHSRGEKGLPEGEYTATVSLRQNPDGSFPPPDDPTPPMESPAVEKLPARYVDPTQTQLKFTVSKDTTSSIRLELTSGK